MTLQNDKYSLCGSTHSNRVVSHVSCDKEGKVKVEVSEVAEWDLSGAKIRNTLHSIETTTDDCSWNLFASKKPLKCQKLQGSPRFVEMSSDKSTIRTGSKLFLSLPDSTGAGIKSFSPNDFSLHLEHVERHGRYVVITSRQKVTEVPKVEEDDASNDKESTQSKDGPNSEASEDVKPDETSTDKPKSDDDNTKSPDVQTKDKETKESKTDGTDKPNNSDSESESDGNTSETSIEEEELSAYESWSEASTDLDEADIHPVNAIRPLPLESLPKKASQSQNSDADSDSESSSSSSDKSDSDHCCSASSDDESVSGSNHRYEKDYDIEETWRMCDAVYYDDPDGPGSESENNDDNAPEGVWDDHGYALFGSEDDFDGFQAVESDSEDCSECGDGGTACPLPSPDDAVENTEEDEEDTMPMVGMPMAQVHVYDTLDPSKDDDGNLELKRVFRFQCPTMGTVLHDSGPAIHPTKPLLVWPVGDMKSTLLFADYTNNTYFLKKARLSRLFSQHVSIQCRFSQNGDFLHVAALEQWGTQPQRVKPAKKKSKKSNKAKTEQKKKKENKKVKETPRYDLIVSTYRISKGKTTRAPPVLVHQIAQPLGQIPRSNALPTYTWNDDNVFVTYANETEVKISSISLHRPPKLRKLKGMTEPVTTRTFPIDQSVPVAERELFYLPDDTKSDPWSILAVEPVTLKQFITPKENKEGESVNADEGGTKNGETTVQEDSVVAEPEKSSNQQKEDADSNSLEVEAKVEVIKSSNPLDDVGDKLVPDADCEDCAARSCGALRVLNFADLVQ